MRIALLVILAGISYASGIWAQVQTMQNLVPGALRKDVAAPPSPDQDERSRLASLYTPRGVQLQIVGMVCVGVCTLAVVLALINLGSRLPSIMAAARSTDTNAVVLAVSNQRPSILLIWSAELVLAGLGFVCSRSRPLLAIPFVAIAILWFFDLTGGFRAPHGHLLGTAADRSYTLQVGLATIVVLFAAGQGMRSWMVRTNKRAQATPVAA